MRLHNLKPRPGAKHRRRRVGKGESSGLGKTSGRGNKGQKSRSGSSIRPGFEGGQMPLARRLPRHGFNNTRFAVRYAIINVSTLEDFFEAGDTVDEASLREKGLVKGHTHAGVKILGDGALSKKLSVAADKVSGSAREKIEAAGGSITGAAPAAEKPKPKPKPEKKAAPKKDKAKAEAKPAPEKKAAAEKKPAPEKKAEPKVEEVKGARVDEKLGLVYDSAPADADDLKQISGVAGVLEGKLHENGVYTFQQIVDWNADQIAAFEALLSFKDRVTRDEWQKQAAEFIAEKSAGGGAEESGEEE